MFIFQRPRAYYLKNFVLLTANHGGRSRNNNSSTFYKYVYRNLCTHPLEKNPGYATDFCLSILTLQFLESFIVASFVMIFWNKELKIAVLRFLFVKMSLKFSSFWTLTTVSQIREKLHLNRVVSGCLWCDLNLWTSTKMDPFAKGSKIYGTKITSGFSFDICV